MNSYEYDTSINDNINDNQDNFVLYLCNMRVKLSNLHHKATIKA